MEKGVRVDATSQLCLVDKIEAGHSFSRTKQIYTGVPGRQCLTNSPFGAAARERSVVQLGTLVDCIRITIGDTLATGIVQHQAEWSLELPADPICETGREMVCPYSRAA